MKKRMKHKHFILFILLTMLSTAFARAQSSFDPKGGCLNVVDFSHGQKLGEYGDKCISANYLHDCYPAQFINDERTQANIKKNAMQWETFTKYLESKSKLKK